MPSVTRGRERCCTAIKSVRISWLHSMKQSACLRCALLPRYMHTDSNHPYGTISLTATFIPQLQLQLHIFVFDETFATLNALGTAFNLTTWYPPATCICYMCFVYGSDEVFLVDSNMRGRIFSTITQQFR